MTDYERRWERLYLGKYILAFYNRSDWLVAVFNNPYDMAISLNKPLSTTKSLISKLKSGKLKHAIINGQKCKLYLIEDEENGE